MLIGPSWAPKFKGPSGQEDVCHNFALTVAKFVFSNSGNVMEKANPPKPMQVLPQTPIRAMTAMGPNFGADWDSRLLTSEL